jgi:hypothetical protein
MPGKLELLNDARGPFLLRQGPSATQGISATAEKFGSRGEADIIQVSIWLLVL